MFQTDAEASITDNGELKLTLDPANDDDTDNDIVYTIDISTLTQGSQKTINGQTHMVPLQEYVAAQRRILAGWIALDATTDGNEEATNTGRNTVWQNIKREVLDSVFGVLGITSADATDGITATTSTGADTTRAFMEATYPGARTATDDASLDTAADDVKALAFLDSLEAAIGSAAGWDAARHAGGIFYDDDNDRNYQACNNLDCDPVNRDLAAGSGVFSRRQERLFVGFDTTDYTRFGFWRRERTTYAARDGYDRYNETTGDVTSQNNGFAYSPLAAAAYASVQDPVYPQGTATYSGKTIANQDNKRWLGNVGVTVDWDANTIGSSDVTVVISDLADPDGLPLQYGGDAVSELIFTGADNVTASTGAATLNELTFASIAARVAYQNRFTPDGTVGETVSLSGSFVGKGLDGPRAVIGIWSIAGAGAGVNNNTNPIVGGFGADLGAP